MAVSLSPEHRWLCQPQQLRSAFCCDRAFSVIDPNYRRQPERAEHGTSVSPAAAGSLEMQLPKPGHKEGQSWGYRQLPGWWMLTVVQHCWHTQGPVCTPRHLPGTSGTPQHCPHFVCSFSILPVQFCHFHSNITKAENQPLGFEEHCRPQGVVRTCCNGHLPCPGHGEGAGTARAQVGSPALLPSV